MAYVIEVQIVQSGWTVGTARIVNQEGYGRFPHCCDDAVGGLIGGYVGHHRPHMVAECPDPVLIGGLPDHPDGSDALASQATDQSEAEAS
ncbi:hypothetical protein JCM9533A_23040 [Catenuloplanes niger JCM 9533]